MRRRLNALRRHPALLAATALALLVAGVWGITAAGAAGPQTLDQRVRAVASQIQCPVCHGESVADSPSAIAEEMRALIRQQLRQGMSEQEILRYFRARYGDNILETPPTHGFTALMWLGPLAILVAGLLLAGVLLRAVRRPLLSVQPGAVHMPSTTQRDDPERERLRALLQSELAADEGLSLERASDGRRERP
jgi:cytochrome c-type biogenesis protein CcmH